jgi:hypothetical protein
MVRDETEEEVMKNGAEYAMKDHGMKEEDKTFEMKQKIRLEFLLSSTLASYNIIALHLFHIYRYMYLSRVDKAKNLNT